MNARILTRAALVACVSGIAVAGPPALDPPGAEVLAEARRIVASMQGSPRGPYKRIRWFCRDGTVWPPQPYACSAHGGGRQHGEYSEARDRLAELGWPVGTVLAATTWDEWWQSRPRQRRLRELALERYLVDVDDGWVMRGARTYRGHVQIEDEERAGRDLLLRLLTESAWVRDNYLVVRELVRVLPHGAAEDRVRAVRRVSQEIAERAPSFEPLRVEIHTSPGPAAAARTRDWIARARGQGVAAPLLERASGLADDLDGLYGASRRAERLDAARRNLGRTATAGTIDGLLAGFAAQAPAARIGRLASALRLVREALPAEATPEGRLRLLDLATEVENELVADATAHVATPGLNRRELIELARHLLDGAYGAGFLSEREREALALPLAGLMDQPSVSTEAYLDATRQLKHCGDWAAGTVRFHFAEALVAFGSLEPRAWRFVDDLLRSSALLPLAEVSRALSLDADERSGLTHRFFGTAHTATLGLNPGVARGRLRVVRQNDLHGGLRLARDEIAVLPETVSELVPVAGILSLSSGNLLSHVQMLARNLGIPNATLPSHLLPELERRDGETVLLAVGSRGAVFIDTVDSVPQAVLESLAPTRSRGTATGLLEAPRPRLDSRTPLPLAELHSGLSGKVVGPKAANLGELARKFPGRVAPAIALPFGVFAEHVSDGPDAPRPRLQRAFASFRAGEIDQAVLEAEVEAVRVAIRGLSLSPRLRAELLPLMREQFGPDGGYGVFVRSDTNVEDLPGFTGAGLNETVPNVVGLEAQLATVPRVWSSPFTRRAMAWRSSVLSRPEEVYTSVLLMKSVPSDKSGVLVTSDFGRRAPGLTVAMAWGVGGAVDGESAEQIAIQPDGALRLIAEAKAPYRRRLAEGGGAEWVPAPAGAVLSAAEIEALQAFAVEVRERMATVPGPDGAALPWDVELGFVGGRLTLFQVRPLVERGDVLADRIVTRLVPAPRTVAPRTPLDQAPVSAANGRPRPDLADGKARP